MVELVAKTRNIYGGGELSRPLVKLVDGTATLLGRDGEELAFSQDGAWPAGYFVMDTDTRIQVGAEDGVRYLYFWRQQSHGSTERYLYLGDEEVGDLTFEELESAVGSAPSSVDTQGLVVSHPA